MVRSEKNVEFNHHFSIIIWHISVTDFPSKDDRALGISKVLSSGRIDQTLQRLRLLHRKFGRHSGEIWLLLNISLNINIRCLSSPQNAPRYFLYHLNGSTMTKTNLNCKKSDTFLQNNSPCMTMKSSKPN